MADAQPFKANAAQLAQRSIKPLRKRRPGANPGMGGETMSQFGSSNESSTMTNGNGGLFGGGIQGSGGFNFSANVPTLNFGGTSSFGANSANDASSQGSDTESEEARRRNIPFQMTPSTIDSTASPFQFNSAPAQSSTSSAGFTFGSSNSTDKPAQNPFSFGQSTQPQPPSQSLSFGSTPNQSQPASTPFQFGQSQQPNANASGNLFAFGQSQQPPQQAPSNFGFGSNQAAERPSSNMFFGQPNNVPQSSSTSSTAFNPNPTSATSSNSVFKFGQSATSTQPTNSVFNSTSSAPQPSTSTNLFGTPAPAETPSTTSGFSFNTPAASSASSGTFKFGSTPATTQSSSNIFGQSSSTDSTPKPGLFQQPVPTANSIFANLKSTASPEKPTFGGFDQQPTPSANIFADSRETPSNPVNNSFGQQQEKSALNVISGNQGPGTGFGFGAQHGQSNSSNKESEGKPANEVSDANKEQSTPKNIFGNASANNVFGTPDKGTSNVFGNTGPTSTKTNLFGNLSKPQESANNIFGSPGKSTSTPNTSDKPNTSIPASSLFGAKATNGGDSAIAQSSASATAVPNKSAISSTPDNAFFGSKPGNSVPTGNIFSPLKPLDAPEIAAQPAPSGMFPSLPQSKALQPLANNNATTADHGSLWGRTGAVKISNPSVPYKAGVPGSDHDPKNADDVANIGHVSDDQLAALTPAHFNAKQRLQFACGVRLRALNVGVMKHFATFPLGADFTPLFEIYSQKRNEIKSKYTNDLENLYASGNESVKRKMIEGGIGEDNNVQAKKSKTSATEAQNLSVSPAKTSVFTNGSTTPKVPPPSVSNIFSQPQSQAPATPTPKGKRKAEVQLTKDDPTGEDAEKRKLKTPKINGISGGSQTSNIFRNILESPDKNNGSPSKTSQNEETPRPNPFAVLPVPATSPTKSTSASTSTNLFAPKTPSAGGNLFAPKPSSTPASNPFAPKTSSPLATSTTNATDSIKPPTFATGSVNFLAQFGQKASKDSEDAEAKAMERAKMEDMDSDEDEAEWEANYKAKRDAEKKAAEEASKGKRASFVPGKGFSFGQPESTSENSKSPPRSASSVGAAMFASISGSRGSSPEVVSSPSGSVLDGHVSGKPLSFDTSTNIFGHLSDAESGRSSKGNEADDDDSDADADGDDPQDGDFHPDANEPSESGSGSPSSGSGNVTPTEVDNLSKDPTYNPNEDERSRTGTPVEETGPGIASARKPQSLFGQDTISRTPTPGGSLFDRISKDSNGNPIRQISAGDKNVSSPPPTQANSGSTAFASFMSNKSPGDNTWKQNSPIKFGPPSTTAPPTFTFGTASPTPSAAPSGLFGSAPATKTSSPFAGLFGNTNAAKGSSLFSNTPDAENKPASVGFQFGAPSTATSSLFPSAAVSTATSRATTPGITTDGESTNDENADPDVEHHEQIDLTKSGAGEEDEDVIHEVRAKALKYEPTQDPNSKGSWVTRGIGFLRILKHKQTGATRVLLRADPSGAVLVNKSLLAKADYKAQQKAVTLLTAGDSGKGFETYLLQVKTAEGASELAKIMEANKPKA